MGLPTIKYINMVALGEGSAGAGRGSRRQTERGRRHAATAGAAV